MKNINSYVAKEFLVKSNYIKLRGKLPSRASLRATLPQKTSRDAELPFKGLRFQTCLSK